MEGKKQFGLDAGDVGLRLLKGQGVLFAGGTGRLPRGGDQSEAGWGPAVGLAPGESWDGGARRDGPISTNWNVHSWPNIWVLDVNGVIRYRDVRGGDLVNAVDALLREQPSR